MRIAVVGAGVAGLGAAYLLARRHDVHVFEADHRPGGHANTVTYRNAAGADVPVDTGFLVHNHENYPNLVRLFRELGVATRPTTMSFSVACERCGIEYAGSRPWSQWRNLARPGTIRLTTEIVRFCRQADAQAVEGQTLDEFVRAGGYSRSFRDHFLVPLTAALWSASAHQTRQFPARHVVDFFANHGMLRLRRFTWRTVVGGSREYVQRVVERLPNGVRLSTPVQAIRRHQDHVELRAAGHTERFDQVVLACHSDQALMLLHDPSPDEVRLLGAITYTHNPTLLHRDTAAMPRSRGAWASWNYRTSDCTAPDPKVTVTYDISKLQGLAGPERYLVSLNRDDIAPDKVVERIDYAHPLFTFDALRAQREIHTISGVRRTWYCGAWTGYGFHEDGFRSGLRVAEALGSRW